MNQKTGTFICSRFLLTFKLKLQSRFSGFDQLRKGRRVVGRNIGQNFAVYFNAGIFESIHKRAVAHLILAGGSVDSGNPPANGTHPGKTGGQAGCYLPDH